MLVPSQSQTQAPSQWRGPPTNCRDVGCAKEARLGGEGRGRRKMESYVCSPELPKDFTALVAVEGGRELV